MLMSRTPMRVSFMGGGSDIPSFYEEEEGAVLSTAIDKFIYVCVKKKFDDLIRVSYSQTEIVEEVSQIKHELVRASLEQFGLTKGLEIASISDLPSKGTGMGSSSSYTVGLLHCLQVQHRWMYPFSSEHLAQLACTIEIENLKKPIGKQDQYIAAYGGFRFIRFQSNKVIVEDVNCFSETIKSLQNNLILLYTGITRSADPILKSQSKDTKTKTATRRNLRKMVAMAKELRAKLERDDISDFGRMLHESWLLKSKLTKGITNSYIDHCYKVGLESGAEGGKLLGAGGGGFLLFYAAPDAQARIKEALPELTPVSFRFEPNGSRIVYSD